MKSTHAALALVFSTFLAGSPAQAGPEAQSLFDGQSLDAWDLPAENLWWDVKDGVLKAHSDPSLAGSILWTKQSYKDFVMELDFKFGEGTVDSGVFVRDETQQIQIGISGSLKRDMTASPYIAKKGYPVEAEGVAELLKLDDWNHMKIQAKGPEYKVWLNGKEVMTYVSENAVAEGPIGLQVHPKKEMSIDFRNLTVTEQL